LRAAPTAAARRQHHIEIAQALAASEQADGRAIEIARHYIDAEGAADADRVLDAALRGAAQARAVFAWGDAARFDEAAIDAATTIGMTDSELARLHARAGTAHRLNLDDDAARAHLTLAVDGLRRGDDAAGLASALLELGRVELGAGTFASSVDVVELERLADRLEDGDPALAGRLLAQLATWFITLDWLDEAEALARRAFDIARHARDDVAAAQAEIALATLAWTRLDLDDARARFEAALGRAEASGDAVFANQPRPRLALTLLWLGHLAEADRVAQAAYDEARRTADWSVLTLALAALLGVATARGDQQRAEQYGDEAWLALRLSNYRWGAAFVLPALASARLAVGDVAGARDALARWRATTVVSDRNDASIVIDIADLFARSLVERSVRVPTWVERALDRWPTRVGAVMVPAVVAALAERGACDVPDESLDAALARIADQGMLLTDGFLFLVPRARGLAAMAAGRLDDARALLSDAVQIARTIGADAEGARAGLDLARALAATGQVGAAVEEARTAADVAARAGMRPLAAAATTLIGDLSSMPTAPRPAPVPSTAVILFTDLVGSTDLNERLGDAAYRVMADRLDVELRELVTSCGGETVPGIRLGDGLLALFASANGALEFADGAHRSASALEVSLRIGVHAGDMLRAGDVVSGGAVNIAARVCEAAGAGETFVSDTVRALARTSVAGTFEDRGLHRLKGVSDEHRLYAARSTHQ
jgi:class 3 adenylate cyclase